MVKTCCIKNCDKIVLANSFCNTHYHRVNRHGDPLLVKPRSLVKPVEPRFWSKVDKNGPLFEGSPCWIWKAAINASGYGVFPAEGQYLAHRFSYGAMAFAFTLGYALGIGSTGFIYFTPFRSMIA